MLVLAPFLIIVVTCLVLGYVFKRIEVLLAGVFGLVALIVAALLFDDPGPKANLGARSVSQERPHEGTLSNRNLSRADLNIALTGGRDG
jgi:hypothetical protein